MLQKFTKIIVTNSKLLSTNTVKYTTEAATTSKKDEYYKNLGAQTYDSKPAAGWNDALPFDAIPGPKSLPVIGNMWLFLPFIGPFYKKSMVDLHKSLHKKYGNIVILRGIIGRDPLIFLYDPDDMEYFLRNEGPFPIRKGNDAIRYYRENKRKDFFKGNTGLLTLNGEKWFKFRSLVNPILMQPRVAQQYIGSMDKVADQLVENITYFSEKKQNKEMPENFMNELQNWALESMGVIALDTHLGCLNLNLPKDSEAQKFISAVHEMFDLMFILEVFPPIFKFYRTLKMKRFEEVLDIITNTSLKYVEDAVNKSVKENIPDHELSILQRLMKVDKQVAITMSLDMLAAGIETTGKIVGAALYYIAKNVDKQECLRQELLKCLPEKNTPITKEVLLNCPYIKAVIKETTRLAPIAMGNFRTSIKDLVLAGYKIPKNSDVVSMHMFLSHSDLQFKEPSEFIPERWLRTTANEYSYKNAHPFSSMPFGFGPRSCVGRRLANLQMEVALAKIVRNFKLSWPHEDMTFEAKLFYGIGKPLKLKIEPL